MIGDQATRNWVLEMRQMTRLVFLVFKRRWFGTDAVETAEVTVIPIGRCWLLGRGSRTNFLLSEAMLWLTKAISGLYPRFQRPLLKDFGNFALCMRLSWLASAQASTASPSKLDSLYPQFVLLLLKSQITICGLEVCSEWMRNALTGGL